MAGFADLEAEAVDAVFEVFGRPATYTPPGGSAVACTVIRSSPDAVVAFSDGGALVQTDVVEVRKSEIAAPVESGVFVIGADTITIQGDPEMRDSDRLVWTCRVQL